MDGAMYRQGQGIEASQGIENGSCSTTMTQNTRTRQTKEVAQEDTH